MMTPKERAAEIKRVKGVLKTTKSPYLYQDMKKYLRRLEKEARYANAAKSR